MTTLFDSAATRKLISSTFAAGTAEPDWNALAEEALFADAIERGIGPCDILGSAKPHRGPTEADRREWARMTLENAPAGSYFVTNERRAAAKPRKNLAKPLTWREQRDLHDSMAERPYRNHFGRPEWEEWESGR